ncbi:MAG: hypothetical protein H6970_09830 [Gammaproteobacteria bacterium]|nr:hypothetical protein [Gammaproteobacteria bacterium]
MPRPRNRPGEAHVFFGTTIIRANLFYAGEFKARAYRLNRFVPLGPPPDNPGESVGAGADPSRAELVIDAVDAVLGEAEVGADHPEDDTADPIASGLEYRGLLGDDSIVAGHDRHITENPAGFGKTVGHVDPDFVGVEVTGIPVMVGALPGRASRGILSGSR